MAHDPINILLVDDNPADRGLCRRYLQQIPGYSYRVWEEESGAQGLLATRNVQFDCLVVDYRLPDMTGLDIMHQCRSHAETAFTPIILLTGRGSESIAVDTLKQGYSDYLLKDQLSPELLHATIQQNIEKAALHQTIARQYQALEEKNRALEAALHEVQVREQERLAILGTTAVRLTHEIGNRLNGLSTSIQLLERQVQRLRLERTVLSETISDLKSESIRMGEFLQDLRTLARAYRLNLRPLDLVPLLQETLHLYRPLCQQQHIAIVAAFPPSVAIVSADKERCSEILQHLVRNAIEAMPNGGTLTISAREEEHSVAVAIHDTGGGIPGDVDVFAPFVSTKPGGTGLGLTIAQQLVQAQQGTLGYTSSPTQGTTFMVRLPLP